jgi:hypothetical protein
LPDDFRDVLALYEVLWQRSVGRRSREHERAAEQAEIAEAAAEDEAFSRAAKVVGHAKE